MEMTDFIGRLGEIRIKILEIYIKAPFIKVI